MGIIYLKTTSKMSTVRMGVNGFGRIGRFVFRSTFMNNADKAKVTAINDPFMDLDYLQYLLKYDSVHGRFPGTVEKADGGIKVNGDFVKVFHETDPSKIGWGSVGADYVCESTGVFLSQDKGALHIAGGAKKVVLSASPKDSTPIFVMGVNQEKYQSDMSVVSNASCTTNCLAPITKVLNDKFGIEEGLMTTVHAVTMNQLTVDGPSKGGKTGELEELLVPMLSHPPPELLRLLVKLSQSLMENLQVWLSESQPPTSPLLILPSDSRKMPPMLKSPPR